MVRRDSNYSKKQLMLWIIRENRLSGLSHMSKQFVLSRRDIQATVIHLCRPSSGQDFASDKSTFNALGDGREVHALGAPGA